MCMNIRAARYKFYIRVFALRGRTFSGIFIEPHVAQRSLVPKSAQRHPPWIRRVAAGERLNSRRKHSGRKSAFLPTR
jgi:hypothetical protein